MADRSKGAVVCRLSAWLGRVRRRSALTGRGAEEGLREWLLWQGLAERFERQPHGGGLDVHRVAHWSRIAACHRYYQAELALTHSLQHLPVARCKPGLGQREFA